LQYKGQDGKQT